MDLKEAVIRYVKFSNSESLDTVLILYCFGFLFNRDDWRKRWGTIYLFIFISKHWKITHYAWGFSWSYDRSERLVLVCSKVMQTHQNWAGIWKVETWTLRRYDAKIEMCNISFFFFFWLIHVNNKLIMYPNFLLLQSW